MAVAMVKRSAARPRAGYKIDAMNPGEGGPGDGAEPLPGGQLDESPVGGHAGEQPSEEDSSHCKTLG